MNSDQPSRDQIETRLTALLLGELPAEEAALLRYTMARDPALQQLHDELQATLGLVREAAKHPADTLVAKNAPLTLKLSAERRQQLLAHFKTPRPTASPQPLFWLKRIEMPRLVFVLVAVACIAVLAAMMLPVLSGAKSKSYRARAASAMFEPNLGVRVRTLATDKEARDAAAAASVPPPSSAPVAVTLAPEPQLAPPPVATPPVEIVLPPPESAPEIAAQAIAPVEVALSVPAAGNTSPQLLPPSVPAGSVPPPGAAAAGQLTLNYSDSFQTVDKLERTKHLENQWKVPAQAFDSAVGLNTVASRAGGGGGGGFGGGFGGISGDKNGLATFQPAGGSLSGQANPPPVAQQQFRNTTPVLALNDSGVNRFIGSYQYQSHEANQASFIHGITGQSGAEAAGATPLIVPPAADIAEPPPAITANGILAPYAKDDKLSLVEKSNIQLPRGGVPKAVGSIQSENSVLQSREVGGVAGNRFYRSPAQESEAKKTPRLGDIPIVGTLFQGSAQSSQPAPVAAPAPAAPAPPAATTALGFDFNAGAPTVSVSPPGSSASERDQSVTVFRITNANPRLLQQRSMNANSTLGATISDLPLRKPAPNAPVPQPEILTHENNFSTFSLNVSDVSFKFAEASLQNGKLPDTASIRSEEFINAFDYRDPEAAAGQPMAFMSERARYPFAHNRELLRFAVKTAAAGRPAGRALNLVLLLDNSGSMERADRVAIIRESLRVLATQLQPQDTVSVVTFARTARLWADGISGDKAGATLDQVGGITPEGGTNLEEAMRLAYETAHRHYLPNGLNRVVLLTDGAANLGNVEPEALKQKVEAQRKQGIALDCFGIGWEDYNDDLLEQLSSHGDGRYAFLNSPEDAAKDFAAKLAGALQIAAADVKVQVEFNPSRVISYRQIGYTRHQLTKEQFRDNTVAAGEIAAQEAGNALYTIETNPNGDGPIATVHVRYRIPGASDYREHSWDVAYTGGAPALDQSSPAMRLAATASAFSEWLAASPFAQEVTLDGLLKVLSGVPEIYGADDRPKQLETMIREAKSLEGKPNEGRSF